MQPHVHLQYDALSLMSGKAPLRQLNVPGAVIECEKSQGEIEYKRNHTEEEEIWGGTSYDKGEEDTDTNGMEDMDDQEGGRNRDYSYNKYTPSDGDLPGYVTTT